jgi:hypothetical protein
VFYKFNLTPDKLLFLCLIESNPMKRILLLTLVVVSFTACLKEDGLSPNKNASPLTQQPVVMDTTGSGTSGGGGTTGGGSSDPEFFNYTLDGQTVNLTDPQFTGSTGFGQIISQLTGSEFFQVALTLAGRSFPDTTRLSIFSSTVVYNETVTKRYNGESGMFIFTTDSPEKITGNFDMVMTNEANANDSIIVTNGSFSVNK